LQLASFLQLETETNQAQQEGHTEKKMKIKLPTLSELSEEYDLLLSQKKQAGEQLSHLNEELKNLRHIKSNMDTLLDDERFEEGQTQRMRDAEPEHEQHTTGKDR
jgi:hypothetical protein